MKYLNKFSSFYETFNKDFISSYLKYNRVKPSDNDFMRATADFKKLIPKHIPNGEFKVNNNIETYGMNISFKSGDIIKSDNGNIYLLYNNDWELYRYLDMSSFNYGRTSRFFYDFCNSVTKIIKEIGDYITNNDFESSDIKETRTSHILIGDKYVIKRFKKFNSESFDYIKKLFDSIIENDYPYFIKFYKTWYDDGYLFVSMEKVTQEEMDKGDDYISEKRMEIADKLYEFKKSGNKSKILALNGGNGYVYTFNSKKFILKTDVILHLIRQFIKGKNNEELDCIIDNDLVKFFINVMRLNSVYLSDIYSGENVAFKNGQLKIIDFI